MSTPVTSLTRAIRNIVQYSSFLSFLLLLGCLDLSDSNSKQTESLSNAYSDTKIEGQAVNSLIEEGIIQPYQIIHSEENSVISKTPFGLPIRTDQNGHFSFRIPNDIQAASILIKVTADETTRMPCDIMAG